MATHSWRSGEHRLACQGDRGEGPSGTPGSERFCNYNSSNGKDYCGERTGGSRDDNQVESLKASLFNWSGEVNG